MGKKIYSHKRLGVYRPQKLKNKIAMKNNFISNRKYEGGAFVDDKRTFGKIAIDGCSVIYAGPDGRKKLPLSGICLRAGGAADKTIFFTHPGSPEIIFFTTDKSVLKDPFLSSKPDT